MYRRGNRRPIIILLVVTSIALITLDVREAGPITGAKGVAREVVAPVASAADRVFSPVGDWIGGVFRAGSLRSENERLKRDLEEARGSDAQQQALESENLELRELLDLPFVADSDAITAQVVSGAPGNFEWTVQIDKGTNSGVTDGMAVVTGAGLVGKIVDATEGGATVLLMTDPQFGVGVIIEAMGVDGLETRTSGFAVGRTGEDLVRLNNVDPTVRVTKDAYVWTSGANTSQFPGSIPVGRVQRVEKRAGEIQQDILVEPQVDLDSLEFVKVLPQPTVQTPAP
ncbi:MAG: rod shape-determining protein MreC [Acidimicrobiia bacterium]